jgi:hypothetical protein
MLHKVSLCASTLQIWFFPVICWICIYVVGKVFFNYMSCFKLLYKHSRIIESPVIFVLPHLPSDLFHVTNMSCLYQRHLPVMLSMLEPPV